MKYLFAILLNSLILYVIEFLLSGTSTLADGVIVSGGWKAYIIGGIILGLINTFIKPVLKLLSLPLFFLTLGLVGLVINGFILYLMTFIMDNLLMMDGVSYTIIGWFNLIIATVIFTIMNVILSFFGKKS